MNSIFLLYSILASKYSSKDTHNILRNFVRIIRLQFGGSLSKAFNQPQESANQESSNTRTNLKDKELDKLVSGLFLNILIDTNILKENRFPSSAEDVAQLSSSKASVDETLQPVSQWLLLPVDIQFQVSFQYIYM